MSWLQFQQWLASLSADELAKVQEEVELTVQQRAEALIKLIDTDEDPELILKEK